MCKSETPYRVVNCNRRRCAHHTCGATAAACGSSHVVGGQQRLDGGALQLAVTAMVLELGQHALRVCGIYHGALAGAQTTATRVCESSLCNAVVTTPPVPRTYPVALSSIMYA